MRATEKDGKPEPPQLAMLSMNGGDAWTFTDLPKGAGPPRWSPDGRTIAFTGPSNPEDIAKQQKKKQKEEEAKKGSRCRESFAGRLRQTDGVSSKGSGFR
jgi:Periplasmic component of the Tol biopolymer transport system